jgi:hypothetical protein
MFRYAGVYCPNEDCKTFIICKELGPNEPTPTVKAIGIVTGSCPKCRREYSLTTAEIVEIESEMRPANDPSTLPSE